MTVAFIDGKQVDAATAQASGMFSSSQIASLTPSTSNPISYSAPAPSPTPAKPEWSWFLGGAAATDAQKSYAQSKGISFDQAAYEMNKQKTPTNSYTTVTGNQVTTDSTGKIITATKPIEWVTIPEQTSTPIQNPLSANYIPDTNIKIPNILNDVNFKTGKVGVLTDKQKQELNIAFGRASGGTGTQEDYANLKNAIEQYGWRPTGLSDMNKWDLTDFVNEEKGSDIKTSDLSWENIEWITSKAWLEDENIKSVVDKYEKQMSDIVNQKVDDISKKMNSLYEKIDTLSTKMQTEMDDMNIPQLYKYAMEAFDLAGKLKTSSDIANSLQSMLTTVWEDVPWQGRVAKQIISANAYGKVAGLTAAYNIAKDNVTTGSWLINNYYQGLSNTLTQRMSTLQWLLNSNSTMYANLSQDEKSYIQAQLSILQNQANEYTSTWEMISEFTKDPAFIYAEPFDLDNETTESAAKKISEAKFKYEYAKKVLESYPDAKIDASMSLSAMQDAVTKSQKFIAEASNSSNWMSDAQVLNRAKFLYDEYKQKGKYITMTDAENMIRNGTRLDETYGVGFYNKLRMNAADAINRIQNTDTQVSKLYAFDQAIKNGDVNWAIQIINDSAYEAMSPSDKTQVDNLKTINNQISVALWTINRVWEWYETGTWTTIWNTILSKLQKSKDSNLQEIYSDVWLAISQYKYLIYGSNLSTWEIKQADQFIPDLEKSTLANAVTSLQKLQSFLDLKNADKYVSRWWIDINNSMESIVNKYVTGSPELKQLIDAIYTSNPLATPAEVVDFINKKWNEWYTGNTGSKGSSSSQSYLNSSYRWSNDYINMQNMVIQNNTNKQVSNMWTLYPQGSYWNWCGVFASTITDRSYKVWDLYTQKQSTVDTYWLLKDKWTTPQVWQTLIFDAPEVYDENGNKVKYWHVAVINKINSDGTIVLSESNYYNNMLVTHDRVMKIDPSDSAYRSLYGILPTKLK